MKPRYINTVNLNALFVLKWHTMTHYKIFVQYYPCFSFRNHLAIHPNQSHHVYACYHYCLELCGIRPWHRLTTHWHLSSSISYQGANISGIATSILTSKQNPHFLHNDLSLSIRITFQHSLSEQIHNSFIHIAISLPLFSLL